ncbi:MAG: hypothetical protein FVQ81_11530 [Candidatus Glassbacteria bacterium]|nr:hypothetical protein [Candidatus Glassbacteria bacterium]
MTEADFRTQIWRLRVAFLMKLAQRLGLEADKENVHELVRTRDDEAVLAAIEATQGWSLRRAFGVISRWFGFG